MFITTTGVGVVPAERRIGGRQARPGDAVLVSGTIGDHGVAVMSVREGLSFGTTLLSDTQSLHTLVAAMLDAVPGIHVLRDPTRGGLGATLNEIASQSGVGMRLVESAIPVRGAVRAACELLGLDPLYVANEGKLLASDDYKPPKGWKPITIRKPRNVEAELIKLVDELKKMGGRLTP